MKKQALEILGLVDRLDGLDVDDWQDCLNAFWEVRKYLDDQSLGNLFNEDSRLEWCVYAGQSFPSDIHAIRSGLKDLIATIISNNSCTDC